MSPVLKRQQFSNALISPLNSQYFPHGGNFPPVKNPWSRWYSLSDFHGVVDHVIVEVINVVLDLVVFAVRGCPEHSNIIQGPAQLADSVALQHVYNTNNYKCAWNIAVRSFLLFVVHVYKCMCMCMSSIISGAFVTVDVNAVRHLNMYGPLPIFISIHS